MLELRKALLHLDAAAWTVTRIDAHGQRKAEPITKSGRLIPKDASWLAGAIPARITGSITHKGD